MADWYGVVCKNRGGKKQIERDEDLQEEDVWSIMREREDTRRSRERKVKVKSTPSRVITSNESQEVKMSSTPVNITNWPKLQKHISGSSYDDDDGVDDDDDDGEMVPPHEYIARRLARTQVASFSMFEGAGRTLKGRDLCKLRNIILTKTGFLE